MTLNSGLGSTLFVLGFSAEQEGLYRVLLRNTDVSIPRLADLVGLDVAMLKAELAGLIATGLVDVKGDLVIVTPPDQGLGRLIADETRRLHAAGDQLDSLRSMLPSMMADHLSSQMPTGEPVTIEVVDGGDVVRLIRSLSATSTGDLLWLRPDQWREPEGLMIDEWVMDLVRSGRRSRAIYPARALEEAPDVVRARAEAGEHVRILAAVPSRISVMGSAAALMSERWGVGSERRLVVRQSAMISALTMLFEALWERAMSVPGLDGQLGHADRQSDRRLLLDQLGSGVKDEQIARSLGLSLRTVRRRVAEILDELGVESRFQAGVEAVRRGWI